MSSEENRCSLQVSITVNNVNRIGDNEIVEMNKTLIDCVGTLLSFDDLHLYNLYQAVYLTHCDQLIIMCTVNSRMYVKQY